MSVLLEYCSIPFKSAKKMTKLTVRMGNECNTHELLTVEELSKVVYTSLCCRRVRALGAVVFFC